MASHRKPRPGGTPGTGLRTPALATAALTSVAVLSQNAQAAAETGHGRPSPEEIERKIDDLYRRAESATESAGTAKDRSAGTTRERATGTGRQRSADPGRERTGTGGERSAGTGSERSAAAEERLADASGRRGDSLQRLRDEVARRAARTRGIPAQRGTAPAGDTAAATPARGAARQGLGVAAVPPPRMATGVPSPVQHAARLAPGEDTAVAAAADSAPEVAARDPKTAKAAVQKKLAHARVLLSRRIGQEAARPLAPVMSRVPAESVAPVTSRVPAESVAPVTSRVPAESVAPVTSRVPAESVAPVTSVPLVTTSVTTVAPLAATAAPGSTAPAPVAPGTDATTKALKALAFAREQLGKPCVWGAAGPGSYDCSGLTQAAWKSAGVTLPRTARDQAEAGTTVPSVEARPGDLVFFHDDAGHVGLCSGDGMMIHAPRPGAYVREEPVSYGDGSAVRRVVRPG